MCIIIRSAYDPPWRRREKVLGALSLSLLSCDGVGDTAPPASPPAPVAALPVPAGAVDPPINLSNTSETTLEDSVAFLEVEPATARLRTLSVIGATTAVVDFCVAEAEATGAEATEVAAGAAAVVAAAEVAGVAGCTTLLLDDRVAGGMAADRPGDSDVCAAKELFVAEV